MKVRILTITVICFFLFLFAACSAEEQSFDSPVRITSAQAQEMMADGDVVILDVRTSAEFTEGHIDGAILIPVDEIEALAPVLIQNKDQILLVYCRSGNRSHRAARILIETGFTSVYDFGGILDWDGPVVR